MSYWTKSVDARVVEMLRGGRIGLLPSDTIYGLSCRAEDEAAVERVYGLKDRDADKPLIILISDSVMLDALGVRYNKVITNKYWPGAVTFIFDAPKAPVWLQRGTGQLAVRLPANNKLTDLINKVGPLVSTSANRQGMPPFQTAKEAEAEFGERLDFYVDQGRLKAKPSTIVRVENDKLKVIREGAAKVDEV